VKKPWFTHTRRFYKPLSIYGWLVTALALTYIGFTVFHIIGQSMKLNETLTDISLQVILTAVLYIMIAFYTQKR
jgi:hypothetical protein